MRSYQAVRMEWWHEDDVGVGRSCTDVAEVERLHRGARGGARASNDAEPLNASHADINSMSPLSNRVTFTNASGRTNGASEQQESQDSAKYSGSRPSSHEDSTPTWPSWSDHYAGNNSDGPAT